MPGDPEPVAETSGAMVVAPARVPRAEPGIDDLPRDVLPRVLACLDAREAVQTCVLSKLWRDLWRDARRINASCRAFEIDGELDDHGRSLFKKFANRLLMLRNPVSLDEFRLWYCIDGRRLYADAAEPNLWIRHALLCEARSVEIFAWHEKLELNPAVFTSEHLTSLLLYSVVLTNGFFRQIQNGCKAMERLILQECPINDIEIASQTLKFLSIGHNCWFQPRPNDPAHPPSLSLPNLIHLGFFGHLTFIDYGRIPLVKNMESLQTAYIDLLKCNDLPVDDIRQLLLGLSGVTKLEFCFGFGQEELMMGMDLQWCPKFNNLKFLILGNWYLDANFYGLIAFLQNSPNLEHLTLNLKLEQHAKVPGALMGWAGNRPFTCEHLKTVEIICSEDDPAINSLTKFLVRCGISDGQIHIKH